MQNQDLNSCLQETYLDFENLEDEFVDSVASTDHAEEILDNAPLTPFSPQTPFGRIRSPPSIINYNTIYPEELFGSSTPAPSVLDNNTEIEEDLFDENNINNLINILNLMNGHTQDAQENAPSDSHMPEESWCKGGFTDSENETFQKTNSSSLVSGKRKCEDLYYNKSKKLKSDDPDHNTNDRIQSSQRQHTHSSSIYDLTTDINGNSIPPQSKQEDKYGNMFLFTQDSTLNPHQSFWNDNQIESTHQSPKSNTHLDAFQLPILDPFNANSITEMSGSNTYSPTSPHTSDQYPPQSNIYSGHENAASKPILYIPISSVVPFTLHNFVPISEALPNNEEPPLKKLEKHLNSKPKRARNKKSKSSLDSANPNRRNTFAPSMSCAIPSIIDQQAHNDKSFLNEGQNKKQEKRRRYSKSKTIPNSSQSHEPLHYQENIFEGPTTSTSLSSFHASHSFQTSFQRVPSMASSSSHSSVFDATATGQLEVNPPHLFKSTSGEVSNDYAQVQCIADPKLEEANQQAMAQRSETPLIKYSLKQKILLKRCSKGEADIQADFSPRPKPPLTKEEIDKNERRKSLNREAAARHRKNKLQQREDQEKEVKLLMGKNSDLKETVFSLDREKEALIMKLLDKGFTEQKLEDVLLGMQLKS
ncbi:homeobox protein 3-like [Biomphalaria glabrata]|uniref:Homeobox protein 3-like n=1 Tax=Biomphalaria glabrata TaxID=6526 RepID=A0A9W3A0B2_BIOGL|nr:homeobox protein 3-like [Biomphalaria glabrata]XP_055880593.1 homeobox protein 3-like [Biomphalaria glabrata]XP_055880595.1 homeobox protein 3-like [Biomphalaria glabrata]XP_055880596.1 homeobox protein 3-like [Biomphalaria glabrata]